MSETKQQFSQEQKDLLRRTMLRDATDDEFATFLSVCERSRLDPFAKQIYVVFRWDSQEQRKKMTTQTSIDGFRLIAERTGKYAGQQGPWWCGPDEIWHEVWLDSKPPAAAKVHLLRRDFLEPLTAIAKWNNYADTNSKHWKKMPEHMLAQCAERLAIRKAFPQETDGLGEQATAIIEDSPARQDYVPRFPDMSTDTWLDQIVHNYYLPAGLRNRAVTFRQLGENKASWVSSGVEYKGRQLIHMWEGDRDETRRKFAQALFEKYPSKKNATQSATAEPEQPSTSRTEAPNQASVLPDISTDGWENSVVAEKWLPDGLKGQQITYAQVAQTKRGLLGWWVQGRDAGIKEIVEALKVLFPAAPEPGPEHESKKTKKNKAKQEKAAS